MARYHGTVGFILTEDNQETGIIDEKAVERTYYGRVIEHSRRWQTSDMATNDLLFDNQIAITANDFAFEHATAISYAEFMGGMWKVTAVRIKRPEIILTIGGVYNGKRQDCSSERPV